MKVLITRPLEFSKTLEIKLEALGYTVESFPTIEIDSSPLQGELKAALQKLPLTHIVIFASQPAAQYGMRAIHGYYCAGDPTFTIISLNDILRFACIGPGTASILQQYGIERIISPENPPFESESLLALPTFQDVRGLKIMLFRGQSGRELLPMTLKARGAEVTQIECYLRNLPSLSSEAMQIRRKVWLRHPISVMMVTSLEGLNNLYALVGEEDWQWFREIPMIVVGNRMFARAETLKVRKIIGALGASDELLLAALARFVEENMTSNNTLS